MKKLTAMLLVLILTLGLCACGKNAKDDYYAEFATGGEYETIQIDRNPVATVKLDNGKSVEIELYYYNAPNAVSNFIALANAGVYDGKAFGKILINGTVMLTDADGTNGVDYYIKSEAAKNGADDALEFTESTVGMAMRAGKDQVSSDFFITTKDVPFYNGTFTAIGKVTGGLDAVKAIAAAEKASGSNDTPLESVKIKSVSVKTYGEKFPNPVIIPVN